MSLALGRYGQEPGVVQVTQVVSDFVVESSAGDVDITVEIEDLEVSIAVAEAEEIAVAVELEEVVSAQDLEIDGELER